MATELAKAYVQIMPSAKGIGGSLSNALSGEADSAGKSAGGLFGGSMVKAIAGIAAAAGIGKIIGDSITEGAALQQSIGGIETLFKDNSEKVQAMANEAYKTAGLSANEYMQSVTSFSASLLQGLGGDTGKASDVANMALIDMSDNANKFGSDMESIQYAYQGFAKQNYTMLDNLKLGYGGTKSEMERLLSDATKISGVQYDMSNLSDVYNAIHVIQGQLDITGTTAKEASTTFSGSFASMKAAAQNVLGVLSTGGDWGNAFDGLAESVVTFGQNLIPMLTDVLSGIPVLFVNVLSTMGPAFVQTTTTALTDMVNTITSQLPFIMQMGGQAMGAIFDGLMAALPSMLDAGLNLVVTLAQGLISALPNIVAGAITLVNTLVDYITNNLPQILAMGVQLIVSLIEGLADALPKLMEQGPMIIIKLVAAIVQNLPQILAAGVQIIIALVKGIASMYQNLFSAAVNIVSTIWDTISSINWLDLGKNIIMGLINGIGSMAGALWNAAVNIAKSAVDAIKGFFGIASPSKLMRDEVGKFIPLGIAVGILGNAKAVTDAMGQLTDITSGSIQSDISAQLSGSAAYSPAAAANGQTVVVQLTPTFYGYKKSDGAALVRDLNRQLGGLALA